MIDREPLKRRANGGRKPDEPVRHNLGALAAATFRPRLASRAGTAHGRRSGAGIWGMSGRTRRNYFTGVTVNPGLDARAPGAAGS